MNKKITFVIECAYNAGGMERMLSTIANALADEFDVSVVTAFNEGRTDAFPLKKNIVREDLGLRRADYHDGKTVKAAYKQRLERWLKENRQDVVISMGSMELFFLYKIQDGSKKLLWVHFALKRFIVGAPFGNCRPLHWLYGRMYLLRYFLHARHYDKVILIAKADLKAWRHLVPQTTFIYNPITIKPVSEPDYHAHRAMAAGRLDYQKGFDYLIDAWAKVHKNYPDWTLDIYGKGVLKDDLQRQIDALGLSDTVLLQGPTSDMPTAYSKYSMFVLSSRFEGFGLVLTEAAECGLPLVSYDCEQGPAEIIINGENGYLVSPVGDTDALANGMMRMMEDGDRRRQMGQKAKEMSNRFSLDKIVEEWTQLLHLL